MVARPFSSNAMRGEGGAWAVLAASFAAYLAIFLPLLPADARGMGHDYGLHLPNLLAGYFFFLVNGPFAVPWFNPSQCAGVPFLADLNVGYYSLPQWLTFVVNPAAAVRGTFIIFAALQTIGGYLLMHRRFAASRPAAVTVAIILLFNSFFAYRVAIGHLTFHPFALAPWLAFFCLPPLGSSTSINGRLRALSDAVLVAIITAYEFQAGMVHGIIPVALAVAIIIVIHGHLRGHSWRPWIVLIGGSVIALGLSADRLGAALAFLEHFPRNYLRLPGFTDILTTARVAIESLVIGPPADAFATMVNRQAALDRHEFEYAIGPAAGVLIAVGALAVVVGLLRGGIARDRLRRGVLAGAAIAVLLAVPLLLNWYRPSWNAFLKETPLFGSSATLVRWFMLYIPVAAVVAGLALDRIAWTPLARGLVAGGVVAATIGLNALSDKTFYREQGFDGSIIVASWNVTRTADDVPVVAENAVGKDDLPALGFSRLNCYQPMFGYRRQFFIVGAIRPGSILERVRPQSVNFKNPACYLFPAENQCVVGSEFSIHQLDDVVRFASYQTYPFNKPALQVAAGWINILTIAACLIVLLGTLAAWLLGRRQAGIRSATSQAQP